MGHCRSPLIFSPASEEWLWVSRTPDSMLSRRSTQNPGISKPIDGTFRRRKRIRSICPAQREQRFAASPGLDEGEYTSSLVVLPAKGSQSEGGETKQTRVTSSSWTLRGSLPKSSPGISLPKMLADCSEVMGAAWSNDSAKSS